MVCKTYLNFFISVEPTENYYYETLNYALYGHEETTKLPPDKPKKRND